MELKIQYYNNVEQTKNTQVKYEYLRIILKYSHFVNVLSSFLPLLIISDQN